MKEVNLEEILKQYVEVTSEDVTEIGMFNWVALNTRMEDILIAMREACKQVLELASEKFDHKANKQVILDIMKQVK